MVVVALWTPKVNFGVAALEAALVVGAVVEEAAFAPKTMKEAAGAAAAPVDEACGTKLDDVASCRLAPHCLHSVSLTSSFPAPHDWHVQAYRGASHATHFTELGSSCPTSQIAHFHENFFRFWKRFPQFPVIG